jgi:GAF domain-containing protein
MTDSKPDERDPHTDSLKLIYALNAIATSLQESIQSEENVYAIFQTQVVALGLRGGISELMDNGKKLNFKTVAFTNPLRKILNRFEKDLKTKAVGYSVPVERVDVYKKVTQEGLAVFVPDTSTVAAQVVPEQIKRLVKPLLTFLGRPPGIFAPLVFEGKIKGMLNIVGPNISEKDIPAMQAFANQIAVALENARLVVICDQRRNEIAYQQTLEVGSKLSTCAIMRRWAHHSHSETTVRLAFHGIGFHLIFTAGIASRHRENGGSRQHSTKTRTAFRI